MTPSGFPLFQHLERTFTAAPALQISSILRTAAVGLPAFTEALEARERALGVATLPSQTLLHLFSLYQQHASADLSSSVLWHRPSLSAREKAALLPEHHLVQKSVTVLFEDSLVLVSGLGDFTLSHHLLRQTALTLGLKNRVHKHLQINPWQYPPEYLYGILEGMVSPFLHPGRLRNLHAVVFLADPTKSTDGNEQAAISLSPFESLSVPLASFQHLLHAYAGTIYPERWRAISVETGARAPVERVALLV